MGSALAREGLLRSPVRDLVTLGHDVSPNCDMEPGYGPAGVCHVMNGRNKCVPFIFAPAEGYAFRSAIGRP